MREWEQIVLTGNKSGVEIREFAMYPPGKSSELVGGIGIVDRNLYEICRLLGLTVTRKLFAERELTVFLGNGLSTAPLELSERQKRMGHVPSPKLLVDMVNIGDLYEDMIDCRDQVGRGAWPFLEKNLYHAQEILDAEKRGEVILLGCFIGHEHAPPQFAGQGKLAINVFGPPATSLKEQLKFLASDGVLYMTHQDGVNKETLRHNVDVVRATPDVV